MDALLRHLRFEPATVATVFGILAILIVLPRVVAVVSYLLPGASLKKYGSWAVVTGGTDGIGLAYAKQLLKAGLDVIIISRTQSKLEDTVAALSAKFPARQVKSIQFDFSVAVETGAYNALMSKITIMTEGKLGVLINNVGISYPGALLFSELEQHAPHLTRDMVHMNVDSTVQMSAIALALFKAKPSNKNRGVIVNISSIAGRVPIGNPLYALYSGTKACVDFFSRSLHHEEARNGIIVQCQSPFFVTTKLSKLRHASLFVPSPDTWAAAAIGCIKPGVASTVPYWPHALQDWVMCALPESLLRPYILSTHADLRRRFLKKAQAAPAAATAAGDGPDPQAAEPVASAGSRKKKGQ